MEVAWQMLTGLVEMQKTIPMLAIFFLLACGSPAPTVSPGISTSSSPLTAPSTRPSSSPPMALGSTITGRTYCTNAGVNLLEDVYFPKTWSGPAPLLIYIHGGSWVSGSRTDVSGLSPLFQLEIQNGVEIISIDYRLAPQSTWPAQIDDCLLYTSPSPRD